MLLLVSLYALTFAATVVDAAECGAFVTGAPTLACTDDAYCTQTFGGSSAGCGADNKCTPNAVTLTIATEFSPCIGNFGSSDSAILAYVLSTCQQFNPSAPPAQACDNVCIKNVYFTSPVAGYVACGSTTVSNLPGMYFCDCTVPPPPPPTTTAAPVTTPPPTTSLPLPPPTTPLPPPSPPPPPSACDAALPPLVLCTAGPDGDAYCQTTFNDATSVCDAVTGKCTTRPLGAAGYAATGLSCAVNLGGLQIVSPGSCSQVTNNAFADCTNVCAVATTVNNTFGLGGDSILCIGIPVAASYQCDCVVPPTTTPPPSTPPPPSLSPPPSSVCDTSALPGNLFCEPGASGDSACTTAFGRWTTGCGAGGKCTPLSVIDGESDAILAGQPCIADLSDIDQTPLCAPSGLATCTNVCIVGVVDFFFFDNDAQAVYSCVDGVFYACDCTLPTTVPPPTLTPLPPPTLTPLPPPPTDTPLPPSSSPSTTTTVAGTPPPTPPVTVPPTDTPLPPPTTTPLPTPPTLADLCAPYLQSVNFTQLCASLPTNFGPLSPTPCLATAAAGDACSVGTANTVPGGPLAGTQMCFLSQCTADAGVAPLSTLACDASQSEFFPCACSLLCTQPSAPSANESCSLQVVEDLYCTSDDECAHRFGASTAGAAPPVPLLCSAQHSTCVAPPLWLQTNGSVSGALCLLDLTGLETHPPQPPDTCLRGHMAYNGSHTIVGAQTLSCTTTTLSDVYHPCECSVLTCNTTTTAAVFEHYLECDTDADCATRYAATLAVLDPALTGASRFGRCNTRLRTCWPLIDTAEFAFSNATLPTTAADAVPCISTLTSTAGTLQTCVYGTSSLTSVAGIAQVRCDPLGVYTCACSSPPPPPCVNDSQCDDGDSCTANRCNTAVGGVCEYPVVDGGCAAAACDKFECRLGVTQNVTCAADSVCQDYAADSACVNEGVCRGGVCLFSTGPCSLSQCSPSITAGCYFHGFNLSTGQPRCSAAVPAENVCYGTCPFGQCGAQGPDGACACANKLEDQCIDNGGPDGLYRRALECVDDQQCADRYRAVLLGTPPVPPLHFVCRQRRCVAPPLWLQSTQLINITGAPCIADLSAAGYVGECVEGTMQPKSPQSSLAQCTPSSSPHYNCSCDASQLAPTVAACPPSVSADIACTPGPAGDRYCARVFNNVSYVGDRNATLQPPVAPFRCSAATNTCTAPVAPQPGATSWLPAVSSGPRSFYSDGDYTCHLCNISGGIGGVRRIVVSNVGCPADPLTVPYACNCQVATPPPLLCNDDDDAISALVGCVPGADGDRYCRTAFNADNYVPGTVFAPLDAFTCSATTNTCVAPLETAPPAYALGQRRCLFADDTNLCHVGRTLEINDGDSNKVLCLPDHTLLPSTGVYECACTVQSPRPPPPPPPACTSDVQCADADWCTDDRCFNAGVPGAAQCANLAITNCGSSSAAVACQQHVCELPAVSNVRRRDAGVVISAVNIPNFAACETDSECPTQRQCIVGHCGSGGHCVYIEQPCTQTTCLPTGIGGADGAQRCWFAGYNQTTGAPLCLTTPFAQDPPSDVPPLVCVGGCPTHANDVTPSNARCQPNGASSACLCVAPPPPTLAPTSTPQSPAGNGSTPPSTPKDNGSLPWWILLAAFGWWPFLILLAALLASVGACTFGCFWCRRRRRRRDNARRQGSRRNSMDASEPPSGTLLLPHQHQQPPPPPQEQPRPHSELALQKATRRRMNAILNTS